MTAAPSSLPVVSPETERHVFEHAYRAAQPDADLRWSPETQSYLLPATAGAFVGWMLARTQIAQERGDLVENLCARIKAADDAAADNDYMLDSRDCIRVLRGQWNGPLQLEMPAAPRALVRRTGR